MPPLYYINVFDVFSYCLQVKLRSGGLFQVQRANVTSCHITLPDNTGLCCGKSCATGNAAALMQLYH